jgi:metal-responsive CopG/Arc/MetJ family transcriptional regulator
MAKLNFSLPDEVKQEFNELFANENKSAVLTRLIIQAIDEKKQAQRRQEAYHRILARREQAQPMSAQEFQALRDELRQ